MAKHKRNKKKSKQPTERIVPITAAHESQSAPTTLPTQHEESAAPIDVEKLAKLVDGLRHEMGGLHDDVKNLRQNLIAHIEKSREDTFHVKKAVMDLAVESVSASERHVSMWKELRDLTAHSVFASERYGYVMKQVRDLNADSLSATERYISVTERYNSVTERHNSVMEKLISHKYQLQALRDMDDDLSYEWLQINERLKAVERLAEAERINE